MKWQALRMDKIRKCCCRCYSRKPIRKLIKYYNGLSVYALHTSLPTPRPIHVLKPNAQCDGVRR